MITLLNIIFGVIAALLAFHWLTEARRIPAVGRLGCALVIIGQLWCLPFMSPGIFCVRLGLCLWLGARLFQARQHS